MSEDKKNNKNNLKQQKKQIESELKRLGKLENEKEKEFKKSENRTKKEIKKTEAFFEKLKKYREKGAKEKVISSIRTDLEKQKKKTENLMKGTEKAKNDFLELKKQKENEVERLSDLEAREKEAILSEKQRKEQAIIQRKREAEEKRRVEVKEKEKRKLEIEKKRQKEIAKAEFSKLSKLENKKEKELKNLEESFKKENEKQRAELEKLEKSKQKQIEKISKIFVPQKIDQISNKFLTTLGAAQRGLIPRVKDVFISLLPVGTEERYRRSQMISFLNFIRNWIISIALVFIILFGVVYFLVDKFNSDAEKELINLRAGSMTAQLQEIRGKAMEFNESLTLMESLQKDISPFSELFEELQKRKVSGIIFTSVEAKTFETEIVLRGIAEKRENLLAFKENLIKSEFLTNVNMPTQILEKVENISFIIKFKIK